MATRETQNRILNTAIELFNECGSARISANRVADECGVSRGNLYYHFKNKQAIISAIYDSMVGEIKNTWVNDKEHPTVGHMLMMFDRQIELIWRFRFFYRELMALLAEDDDLQVKFSKDRQQRTEVIIDYFQALIDSNVLVGPRDPRALRNLARLSWILSDNLITYIVVDNPGVHLKCITDGHELLVALFGPYLSPRSHAILKERGIL